MQLLFKRLYNTNKKETLSRWLQGTRTNSFMMSMAFWVETPCSLNKTHRLEEKYRLHFQGQKVSQATNQHKQASLPGFFLTHSSTLTTYNLHKIANIFKFTFPRFYNNGSKCIKLTLSRLSYNISKYKLTYKRGRLGYQRTLLKCLMLLQ